MAGWLVPLSACGPVGSTRFYQRQRDLALPLRDQKPLSAESDRTAPGQDSVSGKLPDHVAAACRLAVGNNSCRLPIRNPDWKLYGVVCSPGLLHRVHRNDRQGQVRASPNTEGRASRDHGTRVGPYFVGTKYAADAPRPSCGWLHAHRGPDGRGTGEKSCSRARPRQDHPCRTGGSRRISLCVPPDG